MESTKSSEVGLGERRVIPEDWNELTRSVLGAAIEVHSVLGPGQLESLYENAMVAELTLRAVSHQKQVPIRMKYKGVDIGDLRLDLVVENLVIVELKSVEHVLPVHKAQVTSYLRSTNLPIGLLINFNHARLKDGVTRLINPLSTSFQQLPAFTPPSSARTAHSVLTPESEDDE